MRSSDIFREYVWLVETIWQAGKITLDELSRRWERSKLNNGSPMSRSTFNRHRSAVQDIFGIDIECDRSNGNVYYIANADSLSSVMNWMVSSLAVNNMITESRSIQNRILLEPVPFAGETLQTLIEAMKENHRVELTYQGYGKPERDYIIEPYCIRLFKQRWYLLGHFDDKFRLFSFDRIVSVKVSDLQFKMPKDFDCESYFDEYFGMMTDSRVKPERVIIRAHGQERYYLRDLPLHHTQHEIGSTKDTVDFELYLRPTTDFLAAIFSRAGRVEIISPKHLKEELLEWSRAMLMRLDTDSTTLPQ
ncbi:MAG: WYL domain-containing protein [Muribaculaceae bacterium]|nr:WYL domain-containing protein [Muribaculaceae bacterium]